MMFVLFTLRSRNEKTGDIPVTTSPKQTCPAACPLKASGCYAEQGKLGMLWSKMTAAKGEAFKSGFATITPKPWRKLVWEIGQLKVGQLWRHNQAGDLPHIAGTIQRKPVLELVAANKGKRGFTYTHHDMGNVVNRNIVRRANAEGFTVNLSANDLGHADRLLAWEIGPVVVVLPRTVKGPEKISTPAGARVVVCPATYERKRNVTCKDCGLCAVRDRKVVVGFPAHGPAAKRASAVAAGAR